MSKQPPRAHRSPLSSRSLRLVARLAFPCLLSAPVSLEADDFLRGDVNGDGVVSLADCQYLSNFVFRGGPPPTCLDAADVLDRGTIDTSESAPGLRLLWKHLLRRGTIPAPFPHLGPDPTEDTLPCASYGRASPLDDPLAKLEIVDVAAPGGHDEYGVAVVTVRVSSSFELAGYAGRFSIGGDVIRGIRWLDDGWLTDLGRHGLRSVWFENGTVHFNFIGATEGDGPWIQPCRDTDVLEIEVYLKDQLPAGEYPITLEGGELVDSSTGQAITPELSAGALILETDTDFCDFCENTGKCYRGTYPDVRYATDPSEIDAEYHLADVAGLPGGTVEVPFSISSNAEVVGYELSIDFNEEVLEAARVELLYDFPATGGGFFYSYIDNNNDTPGSSGVEEGFVIVGCVFHLVSGCYNLPPNEETEVLNLVWTIRPDAPIGPTSIEFLDGGQGKGEPARNLLHAWAVSEGGGVARVSPEMASSFVFVHGRVNVLPDGVLFIRGDANQDGELDLSDPIATLTHLFAGDTQLFCPDAADADDNGVLELTDAVRTLEYLYTGGAPLPDPTGIPGDDPTPDALSCYRRP